MALYATKSPRVHQSGMRGILDRVARIGYKTTGEQGLGDIDDISGLDAGDHREPSIHRIGTMIGSRRLQDECRRASDFEIGSVGPNCVRRGQTIAVRAMSVVSVPWEIIQDGDGKI